MSQEEVLAIEPEEATKKPDLEAQLRETLEKEYNEKLNTQVLEISKTLSEKNKVMVEEAIEQFRKDMAPPSEADIQKLLEQEYIEFKIEIPLSGEKKRSFTIKELPQKVEKRMVKALKEILVPLSSDLAGITMHLLEGDAAKKIVQLMNTFEPVLDAMVKIATISLNPFGEEEGINEEWIASHLSTTRLMQVITAQVECNRLRDFFSLLSQGSKLVK